MIGAADAGTAPLTPGDGDRGSDDALGSVTARPSYFNLR
jgi:hypothetical protein